MNHSERNSATNLRVISQELSRFPKAGYRLPQVYPGARIIRREVEVQLGSSASTQTNWCKSLEA